MTSLESNLAWLDHLPAGWHAIYRDLIGDITAIDPGATVNQAKQKFGEIRVYLRRYDDNIRALIRSAEAKSRITCEECGAPAQLMVGPRRYYRTMCAEHAGNSAIAESPILARVTIVPKPAEPPNE